MQAMSINSEYERQCQNTDRELWSEIEGDLYAPSIHVTQDGRIRIKVGGYVITKSLREWHALAVRAEGRYKVRERADGRYEFSLDEQGT